MQTCRVAKTNKVGETSSKYGYSNGADLFIADCEAHEQRIEFLWGEFVSFMKSHDVKPAELRSMFTRYYEEFIK